MTSRAGAALGGQILSAVLWLALEYIEIPSLFFGRLAVKDILSPMSPLTIFNRLQPELYQLILDYNL